MRGRERTVNVLTKRQQELNKETATGQAGLNKMPEQKRARIVNVAVMCDTTLNNVSFAFVLVVVVVLVLVVLIPVCSTDSPASRDTFRSHTSHESNLALHEPRPQSAT
jgi:Flp pilus assembly protein TadB